MRSERNKGFTFVELLATVVIIGILSIVAIVAVNSVINSGKEKEVASSENMMKLAAKQYYADNISGRPKKIGESNYVTLRQLIDDNYIGDIYDSNKKKCDSEKSKVYITKNSKTEFEYKAELICGDDTSSTINIQNVNVVATIVNQFINIANENSLNNDLAVSFKVSTPTGTTLKSYYYEIYRNSIVNGTNWKLIKTSENINWSGETKEETVLVKYKDTTNAEYRIVFYATNSTGVTGKGNKRNLYIDTKAPTCTVTIPFENGSNGWFKTNVVVTFKGNDNVNTSIDGNNYMSGLAGSRLSTGGVGYDGAVIDRTATQGETPSIMWYGYVKDKADNVGKCQVNRSFKVDTTAPRMWWNTGEGPHDRSEGITVYSGCADDQSSIVNSGVASQTGSSYVGSPSYRRNVTHSCTDNAGNPQSTSRAFSVRYYSANAVCGTKTCQTPSCCGYEYCKSPKCGYDSCTSAVCCGTYSYQCGSDVKTYQGVKCSATKGPGCSLSSGSVCYEGNKSLYRCTYTYSTSKPIYCNRINTCSNECCGTKSCNNSDCNVKVCTKPCCGYYSCWHY